MPVLTHPVSSHCSSLNDYAAVCHELHDQWWRDLETGERIERNKGELIALMHSELSECIEGVRKGLMDDHIPDLPMEHVELADVLIRLFDYAGAYGIDLTAAVDLKLAYNSRRADHKPEARAAHGGKKF